jgi:hypothetical protein
MALKVWRRFLHRFSRELAATFGDAASRVSAQLVSSLHLPHRRHRFHFARIGRRH